MFIQLFAANSLPESAQILAFLSNQLSSSLQLKYLLWKLEPWTLQLWILSAQDCYYKTPNHWLFKQLLLALENFQLWRIFANKILTHYFFLSTGKIDEIPRERGISTGIETGWWPCDLQPRHLSFRQVLRTPSWRTSSQGKPGWGQASGCCCWLHGKPCHPAAHA